MPDIASSYLVTEYPVLIENVKVTYQIDPSYKIEFFKSPNTAYYIDFYIFSWETTLAEKFQQIAVQTLNNIHQLGIPKRGKYILALKLNCPSQNDEQISMAIALAEPVLSKLAPHFKVL
jgi:hypothetical protein